MTNTVKIPPRTHVIQKNLLLATGAEPIRLYVRNLPNDTYWFLDFPVFDSYEPVREGATIVRWKKHTGMPPPIEDVVRSVNGMAERAVRESPMRLLRAPE